METMLIPEMLPPSPVPRRLLPVAGVLSATVRAELAYEWQHFDLTPDSWQTTLTDVRPRLVLLDLGALAVEHRWHREDDAGFAPVNALVAACKADEIELLLWDDGSMPSETGLESALASQADLILASSTTLLERYDVRVPSVVIPPAVQPRLYNPSSVDGRHYNVCYKQTAADRERTDPGTVLDAARYLGLRILPIQTGSPAPSWPTSFDAHLMEPPDDAEMVIVPKLFKTAIVRGTDPMSLRNALEYAASGTAIVETDGEALSDLFGGAILHADTADEATTALKTLIRSPSLRDRMTHQAFRIVMREHSCRHLVERLLTHLETDVGSAQTDPRLSVMIATNRPQNLDRIFDNVTRQTAIVDELVLVAHGVSVDAAEVRDRASAAGIREARILEAPAELVLGEVFNRGFAECSGDLLAKMDDDDFYGDEYLADLASAFDYAEADIVGKWAHYVYLESLDTMVLRYAKFEHSYTELLAISTLIIRREVIESMRFPGMPVGAGSVFLREAGAMGARVYAADRFNYLYRRHADSDHHTFAVSDMHMASNSTTVCRGENLSEIVV